MAIILRAINRRIKRDGFPNSYIGFFSGCMVYYAIAPLFLWWSRDYYMGQSYNWKYTQLLTFFFDADAFAVLYSILMLLLGLFFFHYFYVRRKNRAILEYEDTEIQIDNDKILRIVSIFAALMLVIGSISILIYLYPFGGFSNALKLADRLRQHDADITVYGISSLFKYFLVLAGVLNIVPILFYVLYSNKHKYRYLIGMFISIYFDYMYLMINNGKSAIIRLVVTVAFIFLYRRKVRHKFFIIVICGIVALPMIEVLDSILAGGSIVGSFGSFSFYLPMNSFAWPSELNYHLNDLTGQYGYMFFKHFITDFIDILPGFNFESSYANTSEFLKGVNWRSLGGTPNDVLTYGFLQIRFVGVIVVFGIWGHFSAWVDSMIEKIHFDSMKQVFGITVCMNMFSIVSCADISDIILYNLSFVLSVFILWLYTQHKIRIGG